MRRVLVVLAFAVPGIGAARASPAACPLDRAALGDAAPPVLALARWPARDLPDDCPAGFDADRALDDAKACAAPDCVRASLGPGRRAALVIDGPGGSGRFEALGLAVDGPRGRRFACITASTAGWRHLYPVARRLAPLPWLADVDGKGHAELVVWQRLPWRDDESSQGLAPAVYALDAAGDRLIRDDRRGAALAGRVAAAYRALAARPDASDRDCWLAMAAALDRWGH